MYANDVMKCHERVEKAQNLFIAVTFELILRVKQNNSTRLSRKSPFETSRKQ